MVRAAAVRAVAHPIGATGERFGVPRVLVAPKAALVQARRPAVRAVALVENVASIRQVDARGRRAVEVTIVAAHVKAATVAVSDINTAARVDTAAGVSRIADRMIVLITV